MEFTEAAVMANQVRAARVLRGIKDLGCRLAIDDFGTTQSSLRLLELAPALVQRGLVAGVEVCDIAAADARGATEMMLIGSSIKVASIVEWDAAKIGDGRPGPVAKALLAMLEEDMRSGTDRLIDVPY